MKEPKFKIGDSFFLIYMKSPFEENKVTHYVPFIREYVVSGVEVRAMEYSDSRVRRMEPVRKVTQIVYQLGSKKWINSVSSISEESLVSLYGKTAEEAMQKAIELLKQTTVDDE